MVRTTIYLPDVIHEGLKLLAVKKKTNMTALIIEVIQKHLLLNETKIVKKTLGEVVKKNTPKNFSKKRGELNADDYI